MGKQPKIRKKKRKYINVNDLCSIAKTGDLLLFSSSNKNIVPSFIRKGIFGSEWTHCGLLYFMNNKPYSYELYPSADNIKDHISGKCYRKGPLLVSLEDRLKHYEGYCVVKTFSPNLQDILGENMETKLWEIMRQNQKEMIRFPFKNTWLVLITICDHLKFYPYRKVGDNIHEMMLYKNQMICSHLIADVYKKCGVFDYKNYEKAYKPKVPLPMILPHHLYSMKRVGKMVSKNEYEIVCDTGPTVC